MTRGLLLGLVVAVGTYLLPCRAVTPPDSHKRTKAKAVQGLPKPDLLPRVAKSDRRQVVSNEAIGYDLYVSSGKEGLDVSHYQGRINWLDVKAAEPNVSFVYLKATEGESLVDDTYRRNLEEAKAAGFKVGSYHFYRSNVSAEAQFQNITSVVKKGEQDLIPLIDVETKGGQTDSDFVEGLKDFLEKVTKYYGCRPLLYTFYNFYNRYLIKDFPEYKLMIARYHPDEPLLNDKRQYVVWQYTSRGRVIGIRGNVDRSRLMAGFSLGDLLY